MEKEKIKEILKGLKLALYGGHLTYHAAINDAEFQKALVEILEEVSEWSEEDEKKLSVLAEKVEKETESKKTAGEKFKTIKEILKIGGAAAIGVGAGLAGYAAYQALKKKK